MATYVSLCEYLSKSGGIRLFRNQSPTIGASCLVSMDARKWHKARPFRKMLVRDDSGICPDDAARMAWEAGYFGDAADRPDVNDLLDAIGRELSGCPVYSTDDTYAMESAAMAEIEEADYAAEFIPGPEIEYYERTYTNRKGKPGVQYFAKVTKPGAKKPAFHTVFRCPAERESTVQSFLAGGV
jgi:hypothetical protein